MMKYVSIDLETTGLDCETCQILEMAAVVDDFVSPLDSLPKFHAYLYHDIFTGQPQALAMNAEIIRIIGEKKHPELQFGERNLCRAFNIFLGGVLGLVKVTDEQGKSEVKPIKVTATGKNFATFDMPFLRKLQGYQPWFHRRVLDVGNLYLDPRTDAVIPATDECCRRAGLTDRTKHDAMDDALIVCKLIRKHYGFAF